MVSLPRRMTHSIPMPLRSARRITRTGLGVHTHCLCFTDDRIGTSRAVKVAVDRVVRSGSGWRFRLCFVAGFGNFIFFNLGKPKGLRKRSREQRFQIFPVLRSVYGRGCGGPGVTNAKAVCESHRFGRRGAAILFCGDSGCEICTPVAD